MVSVVIPSYKDPLLWPTIRSLLDMAEGEIEVIAVFDGYWPDPKDIIHDNRVRYVHIGKNQGMRNAINSGVRIARGEYIMRTDEHACFSKGYDRVLTETIEDNWIVTPRRYFLDTEKWEVMDLTPVDDMKLKIARVGDDNGGLMEKFSGVTWNRPGLPAIHETMAMQGSCWVMKKTWWDTIGELESDGYGTHYQDSHEMVFKTWQKGGKLMVNTNAWHAHKHRKFPRTHGYGGKEARDGFTYSLNLWREYYDKEVRPRWGI